MRYLTALGVGAVALLLAGCATTQEPRIEVRVVKVPIPVECQEPIPERPIMPTEALKPGIPIDKFIPAAQAEIDRREGYEIKLRAALGICTAPLNTGMPVPHSNALGGHITEK